MSSGTVTWADLSSRLTDTSLAPGRPSSARVTCLTQLPQVMPSIPSVFFIVVPPCWLVIDGTPFCRTGEDDSAVRDASRLVSTLVSNVEIATVPVIRSAAPSGPAVSDRAACFGLNRRSRSALPTTNTELKLIASAAIIGFILRSKAAYQQPAAIGMPMML